MDNNQIELAITISSIVLFLSFEIIGVYLAHLVFELRYVWVNLQRN